MSALCFENTSAFQFRIARNDSPIFPFKCSISGKTGLSDSSSYDKGRSGKFEQLDKPSSVFHIISLQDLCLFLVGPHRQSIFPRWIESVMSSVFNNTLTHSPFRVTEKLRPKITEI